MELGAVLAMIREGLFIVGWLGVSNRGQREDGEVHGNKFHRPQHMESNHDAEHKSALH
jgi:hypothetical protein